jgi:hypothetical protein
MITVGKWRWPLVVGLPLVAAGFLVGKGIVRLNYQGQAILAYSGGGKMNVDPNIFQPHRAAQIVFEKVPGHPLQLAMRADGPRPDDVVQGMRAVGHMWAEQSLTRQRADLKKVQDVFQKQLVDLDANFNQLMVSRAALLSGPKRNTPRAQIVAKIEALKARRQLLIERYPTHTDIPLLAKQIQDLLKQLGSRPAPLSEKLTDLDRQLNQTKLRRDYFSRRLQRAAQAERDVKPYWKIMEPVQKPKWPNRVIGWPVGAGVVVGLFIVGFVALKGNMKMKKGASGNGLWRPQVPETPVALQVVSPEPTAAVAPPAEPPLPSDPLTEKAAALYLKWVEMAKILYTPAAGPPQGVLDQVGPLLQESSEFIPQGHEVLARYLARSVTPGDLAAHVARTVLMTLSGAQNAGVSEEHCLAMALAALFHDLAVVARPPAIQEEVGSEVGRLSASVLRRIPGLQPALLSMVEEILIGMDEFKLETWQNVANGLTLEPLSKVLREIDRFEKVMQKQKSRLERRVANQ